jgi:hypothetical protein
MGRDGPDRCHFRGDSLKTARIHIESDTRLTTIPALFHDVYNIA